ncbi:hypothetical protein BDR07DRAFT_1459618 [Suillus spraguei]|nr:hypothetical protein BDR07DRAFT_1459618 [Suillus spraguei]
MKDDGYINGSAAFLEFHEVRHFFVFSRCLQHSPLHLTFCCPAALLTMFSHSLLSSTPKRHRTVQTRFLRPTRSTIILSVQISLWTVSVFVGVDRMLQFPNSRSGGRFVRQKRTHLI